MDLNFEIPDKVWWRPDFYQYKNSELISQIKHLKQKAESLKCHKPELLDDVIEDFNYDYRLIYLIELLHGEQNVEIDMNENFLSLIEKIEEIITKENLTRNDMKIKNLYKVICEVFPNCILSSFDPSKFTVDFAKDLNKRVCNNLLGNAGEYRTHESKPAGEEHRYLEAVLIDNSMKSLFNETHKILAEKQGDTEILIKLAAYFFSAFLQIHPFSNGNGRVARILLSCILSSISIIPVSLHLKRDNRNIYLGCLRETNYTPSKPLALSAYILECTNASVRKFFDLTDIEMSE